MLQDSMAEPDAGHHVEQLEITFSRPLKIARANAAWSATIAACEVLRTAFIETEDNRFSRYQPTSFPETEIHTALPLYKELWLNHDRLRPLLAPDRVPWRTAFWPDSRRWLWSFHHALLDGRSITRILRTFLTHMEQKPGDRLALSVWQPPSAAAVASATETFRRIRQECPPPVWPPDFSSDPGPAIHDLGHTVLGRLETLALEMKITTATAVIWAWGQALVELLGTNSVVVEQIRAGVPQPGCAGFSMHILPVMIPRSSVAALPDFRNELLTMRKFEAVSPQDFPSEIYPNTSDAPVIMVEHETLAHAFRDHPLLESVTLHERPASFPSATAFLSPDLQLKVEGPHRHTLLNHWCAKLKSLVEPTVD